MRKVFLTKSFGFFLLSVVLLWGIAAWILFSGQASAPACSQQYKADRIVHVGSKNISTQIAKTDQQLETGLSGRSCIGKDQAMLFVFDKPGYYGFWMKGMRFPIDMIWLSEAKQVVSLEKNVQPASY